MKPGATRRVGRKKAATAAAAAATTAAAATSDASLTHNVTLTVPLLWLRSDR